MNKLLTYITRFSIIALISYNLSGCGEYEKPVDQDDKISLVFDYDITSSSKQQIINNMIRLLGDQYISLGSMSRILIDEQIGKNIITFYLPANRIKQDQKENLIVQLDTIRDNYNKYIIDQQNNKEPIYTISFDTSFVLPNLLQQFLKDKTVEQRYNEIIQPYVKHYEATITLGNKTMLESSDPLKIKITKVCALKIVGLPRIKYTRIYPSSFLPKGSLRGDLANSNFLAQPLIMTNTKFTDTTGKLDKLIKEKPNTYRLALVPRYSTDYYSQPRETNEANIYLTYGIEDKSTNTNTCKLPPEIPEKKPHYDTTILHHLIGYQFNLGSDKSQ